MKTVMIMLAGAMGLAGCALVGDRPTGSGEHGGYGTEQGHADRPSVRDLSKEAEEALGVKDLAFIAAVRRNGTVQLFKPGSVDHKRLKQGTPIPAKSIKRIEPISIVSYEGSMCLIWADGYVANGMQYDRFCLVSIP